MSRSSESISVIQAQPTPTAAIPDPCFPQSMSPQKLEPVQMGTAKMNGMKEVILRQQYILTTSQLAELQGHVDALIKKLPIVATREYLQSPALKEKNNKNIDKLTGLIMVKLIKDFDLPEEHDCTVMKNQVNRAVWICFEKNMAACIAVLAAKEEVVAASTKNEVIAASTGEKDLATSTEEEDLNTSAMISGDEAILPTRTNRINFILSPTQVEVLVNEVDSRVNQLLASLCPFHQPLRNPETMEDINAYANTMIEFFLTEMGKVPESASTLLDEQVRNVVLNCFHMKIDAALALLPAEEPHHPAGEPHHPAGEPLAADKEPFPLYDESLLPDEESSVPAALPKNGLGKKEIGEKLTKMFGKVTGGDKMVVMKSLWEKIWRPESPSSSTSVPAPFVSKRKAYRWPQRLRARAQ